MIVDIVLKYPKEVIATLTIELTVQEMKDLRGQLQNLSPSSDISALLDKALIKMDAHFEEKSVSQVEKGGA